MTIELTTPEAKYLHDSLCARAGLIQEVLAEEMSAQNASNSPRSSNSVSPSRCVFASSS